MNPCTKLLNSSELAQKLGMSKKFVVTNTQKGRIPGAIKIGRYWRFDPISIEKALLKREFLLPE